MAYFDSPKNRALWELELKKLREEKELRSQNKGVDPANLKKERLEREKSGPYRVRTSYKELLEEQLQERQSRQGGRSRKKEMEHSLEKEDLSLHEMSKMPKGKTV